MQFNRHRTTVRAWSHAYLPDRKSHGKIPTYRPPSPPLFLYSPIIPGASDAQEELREFVLAMAFRHPDLAYLSPDDRVLYADTVLVILFYKFRCVFGVRT